MRRDVIIKKSFNKIYLIDLSTCIISQICILLDSMIAGSFFDINALTAVSISHTFVFFVIYIFMDTTNTGGISRIGNATGRGDKELVDEYFTLNLILILIFGAIVFAVCFFFPGQIAYIIGARDADIAAYAVNYLRYLGILAFPYGFYNQLQFMFLQFGYQKQLVTVCVLRGISHLLSSLFLIGVLHMGVEGLVLGALISYIVSCGYGLIAMKVKKIDAVRLSFHKITGLWGKIKQLYITGLAMLSQKLINVGAYLLLNNVVESSLGAAGMTMLALIYSLRDICLIIISVINEVLMSYVSVLFGSRDPGGIKQTIKYCLKNVFITSMVMTIAMLVFKRPLLSLFGVTEDWLINGITPYMIAQIYCCLIYALSTILSVLYAGTDNPVFGMIAGASPDYILNTAFMCLFVVLVGTNGLWMGGPVAVTVFLIMMFLLLCFKNKHIPKNLDDVMVLPESYYDNQKVLTFSIKKDVQKAIDISEEVEDFLCKHGVADNKAYFTALCLEELAVVIRDMVTTEKDGYIDIQVFMNGSAIRLSISDNGPKENYLLYDPEDKLKGIGIKMVRKIATNVQYSRMVDINILNVEL